ncbi:MAG: TetR/AcrR family transcriptional regulator [Proteobacteria bacterium]|nr:TetR/AcrR family transcriptional regulator [Pseudomonadota bacterium]
MNDTKENILSAACDIYLFEGYKGMSMRKVAERAGISPTAIYRHYENKEALHHQVLREGFRTFDSYLQPALAGQTALDRLNLAAERFFSFATEQNKYYEILFLTMDHTIEHKVKGALVKDATVSQRFMVERVRDCMQDGSLKVDDPEEVATLLLATCNGFFGMYVSKKATDSQLVMRAKYDRMYRRLMNGLQTEVTA